jgi:hypothetical protein
MKAETAHAFAQPGSMDAPRAAAGRGSEDVASISRVTPQLEAAISAREPRKLEIRPTVFRVPRELINPRLVSVMMPFNVTMRPVYEAIQLACAELGLDCNRADNVWEASEVIQDIFSLIYRSRVVVCDFTNRNPNVFYEAGIAHTLGRAVLPITQNPQDIPFDLQHHRYVRYLNNGEGLTQLATEIKPRLRTLTSANP